MILLTKDGKEGTEVAVNSEGRGSKNSERYLVNCYRHPFDQQFHQSQLAMHVGQQTVTIFRSAANNATTTLNI